MKYLLFIFLCYVICFDATKGLGSIGNIFKPYMNTAQNVSSLRKDLSKIIDNVLHYARDIITVNKFEPIKLPNKVFERKKKILGIPLKLRLALSNGTLQGVTSLHKSGDVEVINKGHVFNLTISIVFDKLSLEYSYIANFLNGRVMGSYDHFSLKLLLNVDFHEKTISGSIKIKNTGKLSLKFEGKAKFLMNIATQIGNGIIKKIVIQQLESAGSKIVSDMLAEHKTKIDSELF